MADIEVIVDVRDVQRKLTAFAEQQLPYAMMMAVNDLAFQLMELENTNMLAVFKHPKPFTQKATQVEKKARKSDPTAIVSVRPNRQKYLRPYEFGGVHALPGTALLNPKDINLDQFGQLRKNQIKALLTRSNVFAGTVNGITGIWQRVVSAKHGAKRHRLRLLVRLGKALPVTEHLHWLDNAEMLLAAKWPGSFNAAMSWAIATAKL